MGNDHCRSSSNSCTKIQVGQFCFFFFFLISWCNIIESRMQFPIISGLTFPKFKDSLKLSFPPLVHTLLHEFLVLMFYIILSALTFSEKTSTGKPSNCLIVFVNVISQVSLPAGQQIN